MASEDRVGDGSSVNRYSRSDQILDGIAITFFSVVFFIIIWIAFGLDVLHGGG
jgi:hypothetical protein